ncbi:hypothetical protein MMC25_006516 [Agyrium rufum]|nr:hypothetical protein [Agyrium rufum]
MYPSRSTSTLFSAILAASSLLTAEAAVSGSALSPLPSNFPNSTLISLPTETFPVTPVSLSTALTALPVPTVNHTFTNTLANATSGATTSSSATVAANATAPLTSVFLTTLTTTGSSGPETITSEVTASIVVVTASTTGGATTTGSSPSSSETAGLNAGTKGEVRWGSMVAGVLAVGMGMVVWG